MAADYHKAIDPAWPLVPSDFRAALEAIERVENGFLRVSKKGFVAGIIEPNPISQQWLIAREIFWFGDADLFRSFRKWALSRGANEIQYSCPTEQTRVLGFLDKIGHRSEIVRMEIVTWH